MRHFGKLLSHDVCGSDLKLHFENGEGLVQVVTADIIRVFSQLEAQPTFSKAIEGDPRKETAFSVEAQENGLLLTTESLRVLVSDGFLVNFYDAAGKLLCADSQQKRQPLERISARMKAIFGGEGHKSFGELPEEFPVQVVKVLEGSEAFYGAGDKTGFLNKRGYDYENWNTSNPAAQTESFKALYKSIPFFAVLKEGAAFGLFFDNTYKSYMDFGKENAGYYYFAADGGNLDYYFMAGPALTKVVENFTYLTGTTPLPQRWSLGYHQSRFGYETREDVLEVAENFRRYDIPCDVIHFDIDYMDNFRVFTWNEEAFGDLKSLMKELKDRNFRAVTIVDPGVKQKEGYRAYDEGAEKNIFLKNTDGSLYTNKVWSGTTVFPDFGRKDVCDWWGEQHRFLIEGGVAGIWNDMNEPRGFAGDLPDELPMQDGEYVSNHKALHNVYGHMMSKASFDGLKTLDQKRPFVITRASYAGTQKYALSWTGDNHSLWMHLQMAVPQILNLGLSGNAFTGTDVGGFGSDTNPELLCRWMQVGVFSPLFRNHCAKGNVRQEPWAFDETTRNICRKFIRLRYQLLPYLYDLFRECEVTGLPVMRPMVLHYQNDPETVNCSGQFLMGENLLVAPVLEQGATKKLVYLPAGKWYGFEDGNEYEGGRYYVVDAPLDCCPMFVKEGAIIPTYEVMDHIPDEGYDTLKLLVYPGKGEYVHYQDNGADYAYRQGEYNLYHFTNTAGEVTFVMDHEGYLKYQNVEFIRVGK